MRDIVLLVIIIGLIIMTLKKPFYGVLTWCWISYMFGFTSRLIIVVSILVVIFKLPGRGLPAKRK